MTDNRKSHMNARNHLPRRLTGSLALYALLVAFAAPPTALAASSACEIFAMDNGVGRGT